MKWAPFADSSIGSRRPSGKKITAASNLLQDTGLLARRTGEEFRIGAGSRSVELGTNVQYAQFQFRRRPALFWAKEDISPVNRAADKFLIRSLKRKPGVR